MSCTRNSVPLAPHFKINLQLRELRTINLPKSNEYITGLQSELFYHFFNPEEPINDQLLGGGLAKDGQSAFNP